MNMIDQDWYF